jgi:hypothetical protein
VETTTSNVIVVVPGQSSNQSNGRKYHGREKSDYGSIVRVSGVWKLIQSLIFLILLWRPPAAIEEEEQTDPLPRIGGPFASYLAKRSR